MTESVFSEGKARFTAPKEDVVSKDMGVFYNPAMKMNRDVTVSVLSACELTGIYACDLMAASGVRTIRLAKELPEGKILRIYANDMSHEAVLLLKENLKLNKMKFEKWKKQEEREKDEELKVIISEKDANLFLNESSGFSYIDIDPFGSPNQFLDSAVRKLSRRGILAVTATDTAPLSGTFERACKRNYYAKPCRNAFMHETGLRILIRKVQLTGSQYGRALIPIFSYYHQHYFRVFFRCEKSKELADEIIRQHGYLLYCRKCL
ncbi:MAG: tRNA (guanine(10)-N(2))-dimethyltransferase, partial [Candidatus Woesearchaeota archaeon]|nr:tRNA (guanine(10)-N(2))-dimethyltransferase [Candidatus Woesearchaeota archaeon]